MPVSLIETPGAADSNAACGRRMQRVIQDLDWSRSRLSEVTEWPDAVRLAARSTLLSPTAMILLLGRSGIMLPNDAAVDLFGAAMDGALGRSVSDALPEISAVALEGLDLCLAGVGTRHREHRITLQRAGLLEPAWLDMSFTPIADEAGKVYAALLICTDVTPRVTAIAELQRSREQLELTLRHGGIIGTWTIDFQAETVTGDEQFARLHGVDAVAAAAGLTKDAFIQGIHPDDRDVVAHAFECAKTRRSEYRLQHRVCGGGETRWVVASGRVFADETGELSHFMGVIVDVTEQVQATRRLEESESLLKALADTVPMLVFSTNAEGVGDYMNERWYEFTGVSDRTDHEAVWRSVIHDDDREATIAAWQQAVTTGERYDVQFRMRHNSGQYRWMRAMALPHRDATGRIIRWFGTDIDIHDENRLAIERDLVAGELDHRLKNLFALVSALVQISRRGETDVERFAEALNDRLQALHQAHDIIREKGASVAGRRALTLAGLVRRLICAYESEGCSVALEGDEIVLAPNAITPLALVFHELATNAAKYGALSAKGGTLRVLTSCEGRDVRIRWTEMGGAQRVALDQKGFGSSLLTVSVERQLNGRITRRQDAGAFVVEIVLPGGDLLATGSDEPPLAGTTN